MWIPRIVGENQPERVESFFFARQLGSGGCLQLATNPDFRGVKEEKGRQSKLMYSYNGHVEPHESQMLRCGVDGNFSNLKVGRQTLTWFCFLPVTLDGFARRTYSS